MNSLTLLASSLLLGAGAGALAAHFVRPSEPAAPAAPAAVTRSVQPERALEERLAQLERRLEELAARPAPAALESRVAAVDVEATVRRLLAEDAREGAAAEAQVVAAKAAPRDGGELPRDTQELLALLEAGGGDMQTQLLWERVRTAGRIDEVVAAYEARAKADPNDPNAQVSLGVAYLQKLFQVADGPMKGMIAAQADKAFDRALELDPSNWDARFTKAVSLSHWPPIFGKQSQAIAHFETLIAQQETAILEPKHAQTYLLLGNLYLSTGKPEQAHSIWKEGIEVFPGNAALLEALASAGSPQ